FFSSRRRHTSFSRDWSSDVCSSDLHVASQWQVDLLSGDFSSPVADSGEDPVNLTWYRVLGLEPMKEYKARVRYLDDSGAWSEWRPEERRVGKGGRCVWAAARDAHKR